MCSPPLPLPLTACIFGMSRVPPILAYIRQPVSCLYLYLTVSLASRIPLYLYPVYPCRRRLPVCVSICYIYILLYNIIYLILILYLAVLQEIHCTPLYPTVSSYSYISVRI